MRIQLFGRYQGSEYEDKILKEHWSCLNLPEDLKIRWLKSMDFRNGYSNLMKSDLANSASSDQVHASALP